jgi:hypothetical protein
MLHTLLLSVVLLLVLALSRRGELLHAFGGGVMASSRKKEMPQITMVGCRCVR